MGGGRGKANFHHFTLTLTQSKQLGSFPEAGDEGSGQSHTSVSPPHVSVTDLHRVEDLRNRTVARGKGLGPLGLSGSLED